MGRIFGILIVAIMIGGAVLTYSSKHRAEEAGDRVQAIKSEIASTQNQIALLRAEWSVLTQPARLQTLTERFKAQLGLVNLEATQIVSVDEIPMRPIVADNSRTDAKAAETKAATTPTIKPAAASGDGKPSTPARTTPPEVRTATVAVNSSNARPAGSQPRPAPAPVRSAALAPPPAPAQPEARSGWRWPSFFRRSGQAPPPAEARAAPAQATGKPFSLVPPGEIPVSKASR
jgi:hypothetical protein